VHQQLDARGARVGEEVAVVSVGGAGPTMDMELLENPQPAISPAKQSSNAAFIACVPARGSKDVMLPARFAKDSGFMRSGS